MTFLKPWSSLSRGRRLAWILGAIIFALGGTLVGLPIAMHSSEAFKTGLALAQANEDVLAALGAPIAAGWWVNGSIKVTGPSGTADLSFPLHGSRAHGWLYVMGEKRAGLWHLTLAQVAVNGVSERIDLLSGSHTSDGG